jgi:hypothetical protein
MGKGRKRHTLAYLTPGKETQYLLYRRLGGTQGPSGQVKKYLPLAGFFLFSCTLYCIRAWFFVLIVLHFAFCLTIPASDRSQTFALDRFLDIPACSKLLFRLTTFLCLFVHNIHTQCMYAAALYTYMHLHWKPLHHCVQGLAAGLP